MGRRTRSKKSQTNVVGKGKVTPVQVAFIVDCYLANNNFSATRSLFRSEASSLLPKCETFKGLLSLEEMLDEYVCLKEQKVLLDHTLSIVNREKTRLQTLHQVKNESNCTTPQLPPSSDCSPVPSTLSNPMELSPAGFPALDTQFSTPESILDHNNAPDHSVFFSTPVVNPHPQRKRKNCNAVPDISHSSKKVCGLTSDYQSAYSGEVQLQDHVASTHDTVNRFSTSSSTISNGLPLQRSTAAKNLFSTSSGAPNCNPSPVLTPKKSISSHSEILISPQEDRHFAMKPNLTTTSLETTPNNYAFTSLKTGIADSPAKRNSEAKKDFSFSSPRKRDQVKGRLNFDTTSSPVIPKDASADFCTTSDSDKDGDLFDLDFEPLSSDFSLSQLLHDFGINCEAVGHSHQEAIYAPTSPLTGSPVSPNVGHVVNQNLIEQDSSTKDSITATRSTTKCIQFSSPSKKSQGST